MFISPIKIHGASSFFRRLHVPVLSKVLDYSVRFIFGCWFPHTVRFGEGLVLGYGGLGVVVHGQVILGKNVHIDQNVTIGGSGTAFGVPIIGNDVYIGAGAKILGPVSIGDECIIGANAVVVRDVPPRSLVVGVPGRVIKSDIDINALLYHRHVLSKAAKV